MRLRPETLAQLGMIRSNITHDEVKDQLMRCVHRHYKNLTDYGGVYMDEVKYIMAKSDIESWYSMVGEVPPLIWEALDDKTKELVFEGNDNAVRYAMILTGSLALSNSCALCLEIFDVQTTEFRKIPNYEDTYICPTCGCGTLITDNNGVKGVDLISPNQVLLLELKALLTKKGWLGL